jgi:phosphoribosylglycinamide formyltransferase 1
VNYINTSSETNIVVFASGEGTNFENLVTQFPSVQVSLLCNNKNAGVVQLAKQHRIDFEIVPHTDFESRETHEVFILDLLHKKGILKPNTVLLLLGYMRILTKTFFTTLNRFSQTARVYNLHPADLDVYKGSQGYQFALKHKHSRWCVCVHECTEVLDTGKVLMQKNGFVAPYWNETDFKIAFRKLEFLCVDSAVKQLI